MEKEEFKISSIEEAIKDFKEGKLNFKEQELLS